MAGGATIDHIIAVTVLLTAMLLAMMTFNGLFAQALEYDRNRQVTNKAVDLMNTICLSPGSPAKWGEQNGDLSAFGLQDPNIGGYALSPYSVMRLNTASDESQLVYYAPTGLYYNNVSTSDGYAILTPLGDCVNYTDTAELLGVDGKYGFNIALQPTLDVVITDVTSETNPHHLKLNVKVRGSGLPLNDATVHSYLFYVNKTVDTEFPHIVACSNTTQTNLSGEVDIDFFSLTNNNPVYSFTVYVKLGGITGVGSHISNEGITENTFIVPLVDDFDEGKLILAHSWDVTASGDEAAVHYNASFYSLSSDFTLNRVEIPNSTALINFGVAKPYNTTQIPASAVGILVVSYKARGDYGCIMMPWGVGALGVSASFGGEFGSEGYVFVATELRQVTINGVSYRIKVSTWKLGN